MKRRSGSTIYHSCSFTSLQGAGFEELLYGITTRFSTLPAADAESYFEEAQRLICQSLGVDLSSLWQWSDSQQDMFTLTHLYSRPGGPAHPAGVNAVTSLPWIFNRLQSGELLVLSTENMPREAALDRDFRRFFGVTDTICIPFSGSDGQLVGTISFDALHKERTWSKEEINRLTLLAEVFGNALERKRTLALLRQSNRRLELAAESAGAGLWEFDVATGIYWATDKARELFGYAPGQIITRAQFEGSVVGDDLPAVQQTIKEAVANGKPFKAEYRIRTPDGRQRWICSKGKPHFAPDGTPAKLMGVSVDMTERKEMEERLQSQLVLVEQLKGRLEQENSYLKKELVRKHGAGQIIGESKAFRRVFTAARQVAPTDATVLLLGETGTGKGVLAQTIHRMSRRCKQPLVIVNCTTLPAELIESELFGREKGAFTGAHSTQLGRFELADKGTIFLDEIGDMPIQLQAKLLRILQDGELERLGNPHTIRINVRVIAATSRNLLECVRKGTFREDLFYRLNVFPITIPPLRDRKSDIPLFAEFFLRKYSNKLHREVHDIDQHSMQKLLEYPWPGNVRELEHLIERTLILHSGPTMFIGDQLSPAKPHPKLPASGQNLQSVERSHILSVLEQTGWKIQGDDGAAAMLGINPSTLRFKMKRLHIQRPA